MKTVSQKTTGFAPRVRFNWGYHDARWDRKFHAPNRESIVGCGDGSSNGPGRPLPNDAAYCAGYHYGNLSDLNAPYTDIQDAQTHSLSTWAWLALTVNNHE